MGEIISFFGREGESLNKKMAGSREMQAFWRTLTQSCLLRSHLVTELKQTTTAFRDLCLRVCTYFSVPEGMYILFGSPHQTAIDMQVKRESGF